MKNQRDSFIIHRAKEGDIKAFAELVSKYKDMIFSVVMKITGNREDAEDLLQEIFIKIYRTMDQFRETSEFSTWIYRIAYTTTISELRKRKVYFSSIEDNTTALETADDDEQETALKLEYLDAALKKLPPNENFLITLYYLDEQSVDAISEISGLTTANVKVKLHRIRKKLAFEINKMMNDEKE
ncbi:MAG: sigma-70 family RNA polymerase sigma factor [Candidatus Symbiothrix sp.]|jgi:RNA polymerase sigma-70 factor (ECF subfamily)|nr:sigma-70 family RNA polymerase sigma factor [Candidatus Symbiothrix sp.]